MIRGGDGGALADEIYAAAAAYHNNPSATRLAELRAVQRRGIQKAEARWIEIHGGSITTDEDDYS